MQNKRIIFITIITIILIAITSLCIVILKNNKEEIYTGPQLKLVAKYGGSGIAGQDLGSGTNKKIYNIDKGDKFYEPCAGGIWELNYSNTNVTSEEKEYFQPKFILEIVDLMENSVIIKNKDKIYNIKYIFIT